MVTAAEPAGTERAFSLSPRERAGVRAVPPPSPEATRFGTMLRDSPDRHLFDSAGSVPLLKASFSIQILPHQ